MYNLVCWSICYMALKRYNKFRLIKKIHIKSSGKLQKVLHTFKLWPNFVCVPSPKKRNLFFRTDKKGESRRWLRAKKMVLTATVINFHNLLSLLKSREKMCNIICKTSWILNSSSDTDQLILREPGQKLAVIILKSGFSV